MSLQILSDLLGTLPYPITDHQEEEATPLHVVRHRVHEDVLLEVVRCVTSNLVDVITLHPACSLDRCDEIRIVPGAQLFCVIEDLSDNFAAGLRVTPELAFS